MAEDETEMKLLNELKDMFNENKFNDYQDDEEMEIKLLKELAVSFKQHMHPNFDEFEYKTDVAISVNNKHESTDPYSCFCGKLLIKVIDASTLYNGQGACCDECGNFGEKNSVFWHCDKNDVHNHGFDICNGCVTNNAKKYKTEINMNAYDFRNLKQQIAETRIMFMDESQSNCSPDQLIFHCTADHKSYILSQQQQLLISITFKKKINLQTIILYALHDTIEHIQNDTALDSDSVSPPKEIHIFKMTDKNNMDDVLNGLPPDIISNQNAAATATFVITIDNISTNYKQFTDVNSIAIHIVSNQNSTAITFLNAVELHSSQKQINIDLSNNTCNELMLTQDEFKHVHPNDSNTSTIDITNKQNQSKLKALSTQYQKQKVTWKFEASQRFCRNYQQFSPQVSCNLTNCKALMRLTQILKQYQSVMTSKVVDVDSIMNLPDAKVEEKKNEADAKFDDHDVTMTLNDFNHLLLVHSNEFEEIYNTLNSNIDERCSVLKCIVLRRNNRLRHLLSDNNKILNAIYFNAESKHIVKQQLLDKIHCYFLHSFDTGYKMTKNEINDIQNITEFSEDGIDSSCTDGVIKAVCSINQAKQKLFENISDLQTLSNHSASKFMSNNIAPDIHYSNGIRYFYTDYYQNNNEESDPVIDIANINVANEGYALYEWYILPKFINLKVELINNPICSLGINQWNIIVGKAATYLQTDHVKKMKCVTDKGYTYYKIESKSLITSQHLITMMVYCNEDVLQRKLTETYRRIPENESDYSLIKRHRNYAHLGRLLRECVECFGTMTEKNTTQHFYHGITNKAHFCSTTLRIKGPTSTSIDLAVATKFAANKGLILDFVLNQNWNISENIGACPVVPMFDCHWLSDYANEMEVFFIGGFNYFGIASIITASLGHNFEFYIAGLNKIFDLISDVDAFYAIPREESISEDALNQMCFRILSHQIFLYYPTDKDIHEFKTMPSYAKKLVNSHFGDVKKLVLYGYLPTAFYGDLFVIKLFKYLFCYDNDWINLGKITTVFPALTCIQFNVEKNTMSFMEDGSIFSWILEYLMGKKTNLKLFELKVPMEDTVIQKIKNLISEFTGKFVVCGWKIEWNTVLGCIRINTGN